MTERLLVVGRGGHARMIADAAQSRGVQPILIEARNIEDFERARNEHGTSRCIIGVGFGPTRAYLVECAERATFSLATVVHDRAYVAADVQLGAGSVVMAGAVIGVGTMIGRGVIINSRASVDHDCRIGNFVGIGPGATLSGGVTVGEFAWIAVGACAVHDVSIGADSVIGAGAAVTTDIEASVVAMGVPCRKMRARQREESYLVHSSA